MPTVLPDGEVSTSSIAFLSQAVYFLQKENNGVPWPVLPGYTAIRQKTQAPRTFTCEAE